MLFDLGERTISFAGPDRYIADGAAVIGSVRIGNDVSIWFGAVVRGDTGTIDIGDATNIQDGSVIHCDERHAAVIGRGVTVGHRAVLHGCTVGDESLIGIGAVILNGAVIGRNCIVGAGALVLENARIPDGSVALGSPAKVVRPVTPDQIAEIRDSAAHYVSALRAYRELLTRRRA